MSKNMFLAALIAIAVAIVVLVGAMVHSRRAAAPDAGPVAPAPSAY